MSDQHIEQFGYQESFKRSLKLRDLIIFGMVFMSPASIMVLFGFNTTLSANHSFLAFIGAFIVMFFTCLSYGKMADEFPIAGSSYSYTQRGIDPRVGFVTGWTLTLGYIIIPMFLYSISANFANALIPSVPFWVWVLVFAIPITYINYIGIEAVAKFNNVITFATIACLVVFVICAIHYFIADPSTGGMTMLPIYNPATFDISAVSAGLVICTLCYLGFDAVTTLREDADIKSGGMTIAVVAACTIQTVIYLVITYFATAIVPDYTQIADVNTIFFDILHSAGGAWLQSIMTVLIIVSMAAIALAAQAGASRLLFGMGRDKLLPPKIFAYLDPKYNTPLNTILIMGTTSIIGALIVPEPILAEPLAFGWLIGYTLVNYAVIHHLWGKRKQRKVFGHLLFPLFGVVSNLYILYSMSSLGMTVGFVWMGIGIAYMLIRCAVSPTFKDDLSNITVG